MLVAHNNNQLVIASNAELGKQYTCPSCHQPVHLRRGKRKIAHFAHLPGADCAMSEGETNEHLRGKQQLYEWLLAHGYEPQMEVYLNQINQRPDILFNHYGRMTAVEFQCSPLSAKRLRERNDGYRRLKIKPVWALGKPYQHRLSRAKVAQFTQFFANQPAILYWETNKRRFSYQTGYYRCSFARKNIPISTLIQRQTLALSLPDNARYFLQRLARDMGEFVPACCPLVCHDTIPTWPVTNNELIYWRMAVVLALGKKALFTAWSDSEWQQLLTAIGKPMWLDFTCLDQLPNQVVISQLTFDLQRFGVIQRINGRVILRRHPVWFTNLQEKMLTIKGYYSRGV